MPVNRKTNPEPTLNILFIAAEADPFVKVGGLGDVAGSLPRAISNLPLELTHNRKIDIRLAIPYYEQIVSQGIPARLVTSFEIESSQGVEQVEVFLTTRSGFLVYLISGEPVRRNAEVYGEDFRSDAEKFVFFSLACLALPQAINWHVDILHVNDWHTAIAAHMLKVAKKKYKFLQDMRSVLTIHNLPFMGAGAEEGLVKYSVPASKNKFLPEWARTLPLPMGLASADRIVAVSSTYAEEIFTPEYGCNLQDFLKTRKAQISGILNGIDTRTWDPFNDNYIESAFEINNLNRKKLNKASLQKEFGLDQLEDIPLLVLISRMDPQKGVDIAVEGLRLIKDLPWQAILLGTGNEDLENLCRKLANDFPKKVKTAIQFNAKLSHRLYAGGDILLMPSRYEPCGLSQMIAMRYGCIPVARATGGLVDSIVDDPSGVTSTGFLFPNAEPLSFSIALQKAFQVFAHSTRWMKLMTNAMSVDFSWSRSAEKYVQLYQSIISSK